VLVGYDTADDAGVFRLDDERALVQTLDFFTPVVDDPFTYGAIAAANSLSDVYAMGGRPLTALAIACFPEKDSDFGILESIMAGGAAKMREAGVALMGGHSVSDPEIKFGYSVTGIVHPSQVLTNASARPGDVLVLTKPLGIGLITSGIKFAQVSDDSARRAIDVMTRLNDVASEEMIRAEAHAATDITGNGLLGHSWEMAVASDVTLRIAASSVPYLEDAWPLAESGLLLRTAKATRSLIGPTTFLGPQVPEPLRTILLDPQTSGGLLVSLPPDRARMLLGELPARGVMAAQIGNVEAPGEYRLIVE